MDTNERELKLMRATPAAWRGAALQVCISIAWQASGSRERLLARLQPMASPIRVYSCAFAVSLSLRVHSRSAFASLADVAKGGNGAKSALREILSFLVPGQRVIDNREIGRH